MLSSTHPHPPPMSPGFISKAVFSVLHWHAGLQAIPLTPTDYDGGTHFPDQALPPASTFFSYKLIDETCEDGLIC